MMMWVHVMMAHNPEGQQIPSCTSKDHYNNFRSAAAFTKAAVFNLKSAGFELHGHAQFAEDKVFPILQDGWMPLYLAVLGDHIESVKSLIALGADVTDSGKPVRDRGLGHRKQTSHWQDGWSPLFWAALRGHTETIKELAAAGADLNVKDVSGQRQSVCGESIRHGP